MAFNPIFKINNKITSALTQIERVRGFLDAVNLSGNWITAMQQRALLLEAYSTTHIEGTQLTLDQSKKIFNGKVPKNTREDDVQELKNYVKAFNLVEEYLNSDLPITEALIREIHKKLVKDVRGNNADPGNYRRIQNYVVNSTTGDVIYTPPEAYEIDILMHELVQWLNTSDDISPIIKSGIAQFQLVHIHPFLDGNGRTARLLSTLFLYKNGYDFKKLFTISEYYDRNRVDYYKAIQGVRKNNLDLTSWVEYFAVGLSAQLQEVQSRGKKVIKKDIALNSLDLNEHQKSIVDYIFVVENTDLQALELNLKNISRRTLQREIKNLVDMDILEAHGATSKRFYTLR